MRAAVAAMALVVIAGQAAAAPPSQVPPGQAPPGQAPPGQAPPGQAPPGQTLPPGVSAEEAHAGCVRTELRACIIALGSALWFDMKLVAPEIARRNEPDVNGNPAHREIYIDAAVPGRHAPIRIVLTLASPAPNDRVLRAAVALPQDPELAHTVDEYDRTYLFDAVSVLLGKTCPNLDRLALYRFYENSLKPRETARTEERTDGLLSRTVETVDTGKVPFCGAQFSLHRVTAWKGTPDLPGRRAVGPTEIIIE